jgi:hypothetical protein
MSRQYLRRARRGARVPEMPPAIVARFFDEPLPDDEDVLLLLNLRFPTVHPDAPIWGRQSFPEIWEYHVDAVLAEWVTDKPGTRPSLWWLWNAPRYSGPERAQWITCHLCDPRLRLGGVGTPKSDRLAHVQRFAFGVPRDWIDADDVRIFDTLADVAPYDDDDPPIFESQASYLARHDLLLPGERERLAPDAFEPVRWEQTSER